MDASDAAGAADAGSRGTLTIADKAIEKLASVAATEVHGVADASGGGMDRLLGRALPRSSAQVSGQRIHLETDVAARWPSPLGVVATATRDHVSARVSELTGMTVDSVDVNVPATVHAGGVVRRRDSDGPPTLTAARVPTGPAAAVIVGFVLALALLALGVVAVWDALIKAGAVHRGALIPRAVRFLAGWTASTTVLVLSIVCILAGIVFLVLALKRRSRPELQLAAAIPVHLGRSDVARLAATAADRVDGVMSASATATRRKVSVVVQVTGEAPEIAEAVTSEVTAHLTGIQTRLRGAAPTVTTRMVRH